MTNEIAVRESGAVQSASEIKEAVNVIQRVLQAVMKKDVHYGVIPGTQKPTLYKPGAEKILSTFRIAVDPIVDDLSTDDVARYRVTARGISMNTGAHLGSGVGECSSDEEKYRWRRAVCDEEYDDTDDSRKRVKYSKGRDGGTYKTKQVRTCPADIANTVLKMAKKRAQIDMTLTVTAASDIFDQDLEDMPEEVRETVNDAKPISMPKTKPASKASAKPSGDAQTTQTTVESVGQKGKRYWIKGGDGEYYSTFSDANGQDIMALEKGESVEIEYIEMTGKGGKVFRNLEAIRLANAEPEPAEDTEQGGNDDDGEGVPF